MNSVSVKYRGSGLREDGREVAHDVRPADGPDRVGRFSEGLEQYPELNRRIGRFSDGLERYPELNRRIGRFSDGLEQYPELNRRIGRFSDGLEQYPEQDRRQVDRIPLDADQPPVLVEEDQSGSATSEAA